MSAEFPNKSGQYDVELKFGDIKPIFHGNQWTCSQFPSGSSGKTGKRKSHGKHSKKNSEVTPLGDETDEIDYEELYRLAEANIQQTACCEVPSVIETKMRAKTPLIPSRKRRDKLSYVVARTTSVETSIQNQVPSPSLATIETKAIQSQLCSLGLEIFPISADGNCLFSAITQQLNSKSQNMDTSPFNASIIRQMASQEMEQNPDEYKPFLDDLTDQNFEMYCNRIRTSQSAWGGQLEIKALCNALKMPIHVFSANAPILEMGSEYSDFAEPLIITFHNHLFALGDHYNAVKELKTDSSF